MTAMLMSAIRPFSTFWARSTAVPGPAMSPRAPVRPSSIFRRMSYSSSSRSTKRAWLISSTYPGTSSARFWAAVMRGGTKVKAMPAATPSART